MLDICANPAIAMLSFKEECTKIPLLLRRSENVRKSLHEGGWMLLTGSAAKSIQSINVAAVVVAVVAAAAAVAGLASPAATHGMNKLHERNKTALFLSFFHFFEQPSLFSPCPCPP